MSAFSVHVNGTPATEFIGVGAIYTGGDADPDNWGTTPPTLLGTATKGGNSFSDNAEFRERSADSDYFGVKGAKDLIKMNPQLTINALKITVADLVKYYAGMELTAGTDYNKGTRTFDLSDSYIDHLWWIMHNRNGDDLIIKLENVIGDGVISINPAKDEEVVLPVVFTATADPETFDISDKTTYPFHIFVEPSA